MSEREIVLTDAERKNGWTEESLRAYIASRERASSAVIYREPGAVEPKRPVRTNGKYSPHRWRR